MTFVSAIGTYRPVWEMHGRRLMGIDEDAITMAIAAGRATLDGGDATGPSRVVMVTQDPAPLPDTARGVLLSGLELAPTIPVEIRVGGSYTSIDALAAATAGTMVIAVDTQYDAVAVAVVAGDAGVELVAGLRFDIPIPLTTVGSAGQRPYGDPRAERELGAFATFRRFGLGEKPARITGLSLRDATRLGSAATVADEGRGPARPLVMLTEIIRDQTPITLVVVDGGAGMDVSVGTGVAELHDPTEGSIDADQMPHAASVDAPIPFSLPAHVRALDSKLGLQAARCQCGVLSYPPRVKCLGCGETRATQPFQLPRNAEVYTCVKVHTEVPGVPGPYSLAIVSLGTTGVRLLARVADSPAASCEIGQNGTLVLRRVAERQGFVDYGYSFVPDSLEGGAK